MLAVLVSRSFIGMLSDDPPYALLLLAVLCILELIICILCGFFIGLHHLDIQFLVVL